MKINIKEEFVFVELKDTKNDKFKLLILGAKDFSGSTSFIINTEEIEIKFDERELVEVEFFIQISNKKVGDEYKEVITNKRITAIKKAKS